MTFKAHIATVYYYAKKRFFSLALYWALYALAGGFIAAFIFIAAVIVYLVFLSRSEYVVIENNTLKLYRGIIVKQKIVLNKNCLCKTKAKKGIAARLFGVIRVRFFTPVDVKPVYEIVFAKSDWKKLNNLLYYVN